MRIIQSIQKQNDTDDRISRQVDVMKSHIKWFIILENEARYFLEQVGLNWLARLVRMFLSIHLYDDHFLIMSYVYRYNILTKIEF